jgi:hypothetical protein
MLKALRVAKTSKKKGDELEWRVVNLLRKTEYRVQRNITLRDQHGNTSQIDVAYGLFVRRYVECKNYPNRSVGLEEAAKFKSVLELNGIPTSRGLLVTTGKFSPRCSSIGLRCIDGEQLKAWERRAWRTRLARRLAAVALLLAAASLFILEHAPRFVDALRLVDPNHSLRGAKGHHCEATLLSWHDAWNAWKSEWFGR